MLRGLKVRPAAEADLEALDAIGAAVCAVPEVAAFWVARCGSVAVEVDRCEKGSPWALIAEYRDEVIGFLSWRQDETVGVVQAHAVRPHLQGWGVGAALLSALVEGLAEAGLRLVEATLPGPFQKARSLYESQGFREIGRSARREGNEQAGVWVHYEKRFKNRG